VSTGPLQPYDRIAYEEFVAGLKSRGFDAVQGTNRRQWKGPIPASLRDLTEATRITFEFRDGWPFRAPKLLVTGLSMEHVGRNDEVCLWADDDPAQGRAMDVGWLFQRIDDWAARATTGFQPEDAALDAHLYFDRWDTTTVEVDLPALVRTDREESHGPAYAETLGKMLRIGRSDSPKSLTGHWYFRKSIATPPRSFEELKDALTRTQRTHLERAIMRRKDVTQGARSGSIDFIVVTWPQHDTLNALIVFLSGTGDDTVAHAVPTAPGDDVSLRRRSGRDQEALNGMRVLVVGVGAVGGHVAVVLAEAGVGTLELADGDILTRVNVVRHVAGAGLIGSYKTDAVAQVVKSHTIGTVIETHPYVSLDPSDAMGLVNAFDLVVDCSGVAAVTAALSVACGEEKVPFLTGALYRGGSVTRVRRQAISDPRLTARADMDAYTPIPKGKDGDPREATSLELGCSAPVHNASPVAVLRAASLVALAAIDELTERRELPDEIIEVLSPLNAAGFEQAASMLHPKPSSAGDVQA
jgi:hypothetical protein